MIKTAPSSKKMRAIVFNVQKLNETRSSLNCSVMFAGFPIKFVTRFAGG